MIVGVAVRNPETGEVRSLPRPARHCNLFAEYNTSADWVAFCAERGWPDFAGQGWPAAEVRHWDQGFVDEGGRWLDRQEAAAHVIACGQPLRSSELLPVGLFSEDLW